MTVDRGVLTYHNFTITVAPIRGESLSPVFIELTNVKAIEHSLVISKNFQVKKGKTVFRLINPLDDKRGLEAVCLKMSVEDHKMLHNEIMRTTGIRY